MQQRLHLIRGRRARKPSRTLEKTVRNADRLNHAPHHAETALLLIDVINDLQFDGGDKLLSHALAMAGALSTLKRRAKANGIPVIYANDNFGRWRSDFPAIVEQFLKPNVRRRPLGKELEEAKHKRSRKAG
jgi:nicotinamidase-related amidase